MTSAVSPMVDPFGRRITYVRLSVTDRCDLRCVYCMAEDQTFLPKAELLTLEELDRLATAFVSLGVNRLRLTGGEPLVRRGVLDLIKGLGRHLRSGALEDLTLTTNGALLEGAADALASAGVKRINVSLDSLDPTVYQRLTRGGDLAATLRGIDAAARAGLKIKINIVALRHDNTQDLPDIIAWAHGQGHDVSLIETMPLGDIGADRTQQYVSLADVRAALSARWTFVPETKATPGPARYFRLAETGGSLGFITPLSHNFCESCNRVRVTCTGTLFLCLGQNDHADLRGPLRASADDGALIATIREAISRKPERHTFKIDGPRSAVSRPMSMTGG